MIDDITDIFSSSKSKYVVLAIIIGGIISIPTVLLINYLNPKVEKYQEVKEKVELTKHVVNLSKDFITERKSKKEFSDSKIDTKNKERENSVKEKEETSKSKEFIKNVAINKYNTEIKDKKIGEIVDTFKNNKDKNKEDEK